MMNARNAQRICSVMIRRKQTIVNNFLEFLGSSTTPTTFRAIATQEEEFVVTLSS
uniref:Uncharacterized protein n=1 Tax=Lepeophtheirus salmonis TaxID=72036 RepID=A0A0K2UI31_LEPSM